MGENDNTVRSVVVTLIYPTVNGWDREAEKDGSQDADVEEGV